jgi:hypothetical protein
MTNSIKHKCESATHQPHIQFRLSATHTYEVRKEKDVFWKYHVNSGFLKADIKSNK